MSTVRSTSSARSSTCSWHDDATHGRLAGSSSEPSARPCQQPDRGRPRPPQVEAAPDARAQAGPQCRGRDAGHAFVQNLRRGHYELAVEEPVTRRVAVAFDELALRSERSAGTASACRPSTRCNRTGQDAKGRRLYDWTRVEQPKPSGRRFGEYPGHQRGEPSSSVAAIAIIEGGHWLRAGPGPASRPHGHCRRRHPQAGHASSRPGPAEVDWVALRVNDPSNPVDSCAHWRGPRPVRGIAPDGSSGLTVPRRRR
jgi:hypothetical protein